MSKKSGAQDERELSTAQAADVCSKLERVMADTMRAGGRELLSRRVHDDLVWDALGYATRGVPNFVILPPRPPVPLEIRYDLLESTANPETCQALDAWSYNGLFELTWKWCGNIGKNVTKRDVYARNLMAHRLRTHDGGVMC
jgi:hypothetical protein